MIQTSFETYILWFFFRVLLLPCEGSNMLFRTGSTHVFFCCQKKNGG